MGRSGGGSGRSYEPPAADYRKKVGNFNKKVGKAERAETHERAIARKQEIFPAKKVLLSLIIFGAVCGLLYIYLQYVLAEDDDDLEDE